MVKDRLYCLQILRNREYVGVEVDVEVLLEVGIRD